MMGASKLDAWREMHVCDEKVVLEKAFAAADATQWQGDMTVNFLIMARAARVLAKEVRRLQGENNE